MTREQIDKREQELNAKCRECRRKYGNPTFDHCNYHCQTGSDLHKLDFEKSRCDDANGSKSWGSHEYWKKSR